jgi:hypothetical protein
MPPVGSGEIPNGEITPARLDALGDPLATAAASGLLIREASDDQGRPERELEPKTPRSPD